MPFQKRHEIHFSAKIFNFKLDVNIKKTKKEKFLTGKDQRAFLGNQWAWNQCLPDRLRAGSGEKRKTIDPGTEKAIQSYKGDKNIKDIPSMSTNPSARGDALRDSTGQGDGLSRTGSGETSVLLRSRRLTAEERLFLPVRLLPPVRSRSSVFPPGGDESRLHLEINGTFPVFSILVLINNISNKSPDRRQVANSV
jgi:hypothetical protein